jgi:ribosome-associated toxin RatA of RatAB toxin-antitoxin module
MKTVKKTVLIWYSAEEMYRLVTDVPRYPEFLPWCDQAEVLETFDAGMVARLGLAMSGLTQSFTTRNTHEEGRSVQLELVDGPFSSLRGHWVFTPLGDMAMRSCKVELSLRYDFSNKALSALVGPVFDKIAANLVEAFVQRADAVYAASKRA